MKSSYFVLGFCSLSAGLKDKYLKSQHASPSFSGMNTLSIIEYFIFFAYEIEYKKHNLRHFA